MISGFFLPNLGGIERYVLNLALSLSKIGWEVTILTSRSSEDLPLVDDVSGIKIYRVPSFIIGNGRFPIPHSILGGYIDKLLDETSPEFVISHTHYYLLNYISSRWANRNRIPFYIIGHGSGQIYFENRIVYKVFGIYERIISRLLQKNTTDAWGVSQSACDWLQRLNFSCNQVIHNAVDRRALPKKRMEERDKYGIPRAGYLVGFIARLLRDKGAHIAFNVFRSVKAELGERNVFFYIAGDGPERQALKDLCEADQSARFLDALDHEDALRLLGATDVFLYPSTYPEGLPTVLLEAGAMGCAVITYPCGGAVELVTNQREGYIVDSESEMISALQKLIRDPELCKNTGQNLKYRVLKNFEWTQVAANVDGILQKKKRV